MATNNAINSNKPIEVSKGGTGASTLTSNGVLVGNTTSALQVTAAGTNGQALIGSTGAAPAFATLTSTASSLSYTTGSGSLSMDIPNYISTTFTPTLSFGGGSTGITYSVQNGFYVRLGKIINVQIQIQLTNKGSSTGTLSIDGIPVAAKTGVNFPGMVYITGNTTFTYIFRGMLPGGGTSINVYEAGSGGAATAMTDTNAVNNSDIEVSILYFTD